MRRVGLVVNEHKDPARRAAEALIGACAAVGVEAVDLTAGVEGIEAVVGVGGDGTVLQAAAAALGADLPVAGVNVGKVGYLAEFEVSEMDALARALASDELSVVERMTLEVSYGSLRGIAVNDVVLDKAISERIIEIEVDIDGHHFATYRADGIIVSTPMGSTAYSLSAGGPVVDPDVAAIVLTPVAPHSLLSRSLVLSPSTVVELTVAIDRPAKVNVDGREVARIDPGDGVVVRRGTARIRFLTLGRHPFPTAVRHQFGLDHA